MTPIERKLTARLLYRAADEFSNHGCNDFDLVRDGELTPEEAKEFMRLTNEGLKPSDDGYVHYPMDWWLMDKMARKILEGG